MGDGHLNIGKDQVVLSHLFEKMWNGKLVLSVDHLALNFLQDIHPQPLGARGEVFVFGSLYYTMLYVVRHLTLAVSRRRKRRRSTAEPKLEAVGVG